jgi:hypothetical protein
MAHAALCFRPRLKDPGIDIHQSPELRSSPCGAGGVAALKLFDTGAVRLLTLPL